MVTAFMPDVKHRRTRPQKKLAKEVPNTTGWYTRNQVSDMLGMSLATIATYERRGILHPLQVLRVDARGMERPTFVYDPQELASIPPNLRRTRPPGETCARCFELLDQGKTVREIVIELRESSELVIELREKWYDAGGADRVITPYAWEQIEKIVGPFGSIAELLELLASKLKAA